MVSCSTARSDFFLESSGIQQDDFSTWPLKGQLPFHASEGSRLTSFHLLIIHAVNTFLSKKLSKDQQQVKSASARIMSLVSEQWFFLIFRSFSLGVSSSEQYIIRMQDSPYMWCECEIRASFCRLHTGPNMTALTGVMWMRCSRYWW